MSAPYPEAFTGPLVEQVENGKFIRGTLGEHLFEN